LSEKTRHRATAEGLGDSPSVARRLPNQEILPLYEFGPFRLDPTERILRRGDEIVPLTPKAFDTLHLLVRNSGHLLEKDELIRALWPDTFVEEGSLSNNIFLLRKALGDDPAFIETVPRRGYRFVGAVLQLPHAAPAHLEAAPAGHPELVNRASSGLRLSPLVVASIAALALAVLAGGATLWWRNSAPLPDRSQWVQLTRFPDSVTQPALSPDGRMVAFIRGYGTFLDPGQIYVKILPDGQPVQLTHDNLLKMSPTFSPDGSRIAYTTADFQFHWDTSVVPTLGGEPQPLLRNASGLTWAGPQHVLFSEIKSGVHMGIVAAQENRIGARDVYLPETDPAMAHRSYLSPDGNWVLVVEMDQDHIWLPCRVVPMDGSTKGRYVGPLGGGCTAAAWTPDGKWMYFTSDHGGVPHIWRQRFPDGRPEQVTSGPTEEEGIAMAPDGRSFVTAVAVQSNSLWVHDAKGERQISLEGIDYNPRFTPDGKKLCYTIVRKAPNEFVWYRNPGELRVADLESGRSEPLVPGLPVLEYDISADGRLVVMSTTDGEGKSRLWVMPFDRSSPPVQIRDIEGASPLFGEDNDIFFRHLDGTSMFVYRVHSDGTGLRKAFAAPVFLTNSISPDGRWLVAWAPIGGNGRPSIQVFPLNGGTPIQMGQRVFVSWPMDGRSVLISTYLFPLKPGEVLPAIPAGGLQSPDEVSRLPGARLIEADGVVFGQSADVYAFYKGIVQRNLYRISIP
jgi:DNA-binding winged helix-turn-helix (wHTH) protein/Tol biopolymer transport system component